MHICCDRDTLLKHLTVVSKAVSSRTTLPVLECVLLSALDGRFRMTANDLEMAIESAEIEAEIKEDGEVALEARLLLEIIRRLPDGVVSLHTDAKFVTEITCQKSLFKIMGVPPEEFPCLPDVQKLDSVVLKADVFKNMIRKTLFAVSQDETKPVMTGELLDIQNGELTMVAVDGFRMAVCSADLSEDNETTPDMSTVIPAKTMSEISKIIKGDPDERIRMYVTDKFVLMELEGCTLVTRVLDGDFIRYQALFGGEFSTVATVDREKFIQGLERAAVIAFKVLKKNPIKLSFTSDTLFISTNTESGQVSDETAADLDGNDMDIAFNPRYLLDALKAMDGETVTMHMTTPLSPTVLKCPEDPNAMFLVLPLRMNG